MAAKKKPHKKPEGKKKTIKQLTRGERAIAFVHRYCKVPEGEYVGQPLILEKFQQDFFKAIFDNPAGTRKAILSMAKKNAKTTTMATLLLVFIAGPEAIQNSQLVSGAMSKEQAALIFDVCCKIIVQSPELESRIRIIPTNKRLIGLAKNVQYRALSAEGKTTHGQSPLVAIVDELGQVIGPRSEFYEALNTSQGAHKNPILIIISTQAANDSDLLSIIIDDAIASKDPKIVCQLYTAPEGCKVMDEEAWAAANPALGIFRSVDDVRELALQASRMPSSEASFRNLILNQRVTTNSPFINRTIWKTCMGEPYPIEECTEIYGGLDLSKRTDLTAFVLYGLCRGKWNVYPYFWTPEKGLSERVKKDRAPYDMWLQQGYLFTTPGSTVDYEWVAKEIANITEGLDIIALAYDRWRIDILKKEFENIGLSLPLVEWGQGFKDMSPAVDALEEKILNGVLRHGGHPVMTMCAANSTVMSDPAGNRKLDKTKTSGRIDGIVALAMAAGVAERIHEKSGALDDFLNNPIIG